MDREEICSKFLDWLPYDPYEFQEEALLAWFEAEGGILVTAPTGMGKTLIAEAAVFEALHADQRLYYTTPLIALTDQKFRDLQDRAEQWGFPRDKIGLITGNRRVNPDAPVRVVVAEILLNHLLTGEEMMEDVSAVVMDEFHNFNDFERGIVWELSLVLLPQHVRLMLLSATVGNTIEFMKWLREEHGRKLRLVHTNQRKVPLEFIWIGEKLLTEHIPEMVSRDDAENRTPALVFCFNRNECWDVAEKLKGHKLIDEAARAGIEERIADHDFSKGIGPKLRNMLIRGVGVHHAGILPKHKDIVEDLFLNKLVPVVICTETLAAGINLPARSVVLTTLLKGKKGEMKIIPSSAAHQMFGRAGRPQFDTQGYVYALAHDDDVKIAKWRKKYDQIDPNSKDPGIMRARKQLEKKKPTRRKTEQYWAEGQFKTLIEAGPAKLASRSMIPYQVLIYLLTRTGDVGEVRKFIAKRFNLPAKLEKFQGQLNHMLGNLQAFGYLKLAEDGSHVTLDDSVKELLAFRSIDPVYGAYLRKMLVYASFEEKVQALESVLPLPPVMQRQIRLPDDLEPGPLETDVLDRELIERGVIVADTGTRAKDPDELPDYWEEEREERPPTMPEKLKLLFDEKLETPEDIWIQPKWVLGGINEFEGDFYKYVGNRDLVKNEGLVIRHLLRLIILVEEFHGLSEDPVYQDIGMKATKICQEIDPQYTDRFLESQKAAAAAAEATI